MGNQEAPKPSRLRRIWKSIRSLWQEQSDLHERRATGRAQRGSHGTGMGPLA